MKEYRVRIHYPTGPQETSTQLRWLAEDRYQEAVRWAEAQHPVARVQLLEVINGTQTEVIRDSHSEALTAPTGETYTDPDTGEESRVPPGGWRKAQPGVYMHFTYR